MIRLVATDLDGTVIPYGGAISARTKDVFAAARAMGVDIVYATGRPPRWMHEVTDVLGTAGEAVCANGALSVELADMAVIASHTLAPDTVIEAADALRFQVPDATFAVETLAGFREEDAYLAPLEWADYRGDLRAPSLADLLADGAGVVKLLACSGVADSDALLAAARAALGDAVAASHSTPPLAGPTRGVLEMAAPGVTKATGLRDISARFGIAPEEVVAFGDMPNDVEMLRWAGASYAMAGAHPDAVAAAGDLAPSASEDGVAETLARLLGL